MKEISGYNGKYSITRDGRVWSSRIGAFLKLRKKRAGYLTVSLCIGGKKKKTHTVHRLVAIAFIPNPENKPQVNHKDGNKLNNNDWNLEWATRVENVQHAIAHGLINNRGAFSALAKYTEEDIANIRNAYKEGKKLTEIIKEFNVSGTTMRRFLNGEGWAYLEDKKTLRRRNHHATIEQIKKIKELKQNGHTNVQIGKSMNICIVSVNNIVNGKSFNNIYASL